jgi:hypothetical protein
MTGAEGIGILPVKDTTAGIAGVFDQVLQQMQRSGPVPAPGVGPGVVLESIPTLAVPDAPPTQEYPEALLQKLARLLKLGLDQSAICAPAPESKAAAPKHIPTTEDTPPEESAGDHATPVVEVLDPEPQPEAVLRVLHAIIEAVSVSSSGEQVASLLFLPQAGTATSPAVTPDSSVKIGGEKTAPSSDGPPADTALSDIAPLVADVLVAFLAQQSAAALPPASSGAGLSIVSDDAAATVPNPIVEHLTSVVRQALINLERDLNERTAQAQPVGAPIPNTAETLSDKAPASNEAIAETLALRLLQRMSAASDIADVPRDRAATHTPAGMVDEKGPASVMGVPSDAAGRAIVGSDSGQGTATAVIRSLPAQSLAFFQRSSASSDDNTIVSDAAHISIGGPSSEQGVAPSIIRSHPAQDEGGYGRSWQEAEVSHRPIWLQQGHALGGTSSSSDEAPDAHPLQAELRIAITETTVAEHHSEAPHDRPQEWPEAPSLNVRSDAPVDRGVNTPLFTVKDPIPAEAGPASDSAKAPVQPPDPPGEHEWKQSTSSMNLEVDQPDIGRVRLHVSLSGDRVYANVTTEQSGVREYLLTQQSRLESGLQTHGLHMGGFDVAVDQQGRDGQTSRQAPPWAGMGSPSSGQQTLVEREPDTSLMPTADAEHIREGRGLSLFI